MDISTFEKLDVGDLIRAKWSGEAYVITWALGNNAYMAVKAIHVSNPSEWELVKHHRKNKELSGG